MSFLDLYFKNSQMSKKIIIIYLSLFFINISCKEDVVTENTYDLYQEVKGFDSIIDYNKIKAKEIANQQLKEAEKSPSNNQYELLKAYYFKSRLEFTEGNIEQAGLYAKEALDIALKMNDEQMVNRIYILLGNYNVHKNDYTTATSYYLKAQDYFEIKNDLYNLGKLYNAMGIFYFETGDLKSSLHYFNQANSIYIKTNNKRGEGLYYANVGNIYMIKEEYSKALKYQKQSLKIFEELKDTVNSVSCMINIGNINANLKNYREAINFLNEANKKALKNNNERLKERILLNYALIYNKENDLDKAFQYAQEHIEKTKSINYPRGTLEGYYTLATILNKKNEHEKYAKYLRKYYELKDSIYGSEVKQHIEELKWNNEFEKSKIESSLIESKYNVERERNNYLLFLFVLIVFASALTIVIVGLLYRNKRKTLQLIEIDNERLVEKIELEKIKIDKEKAENDLLKIKSQQQQQELESKNKEITAISLQLAAKNKIMTQISKVVNKPKKSINEIEEELKSILFQNQNQQKDWERFKEVFENIHPGFYENLKAKYPQLTTNDCRICAYIKIQMSINEVANIMNISLQSLHTSRYRIRKKLKLDSNINLDEFILNFQL